MVLIEVGSLEGSATAVASESTKLETIGRVACDRRSLVESGFPSRPNCPADFEPNIVSFVTEILCFKDKKMKLRLCLALAAFASSSVAHAQTHLDKSGTIVPGAAPVPNLASGAYGSATIGTSDSTILNAGSAFYLLDVINLSPSATICLSFGATATIAGTTCSAGEIALPPLWHRSWEGALIPTDALHAVASAASTPASVGAK